MSHRLTYNRLETTALGLIMLYGIALGIVLAFLSWEARRLSKARRAVAVRVHVHGTRGKTSTVRRTAQILRDAGLRVLAKTTGDNPEYILPDGSVRPIRRIGPARITEHVKAILLACELGADALVVEGMALQRENIAVSERILRATHAAVVNVRPDHAETMGAGYEGVSETLSLMIPKNGRFFVTSERTELLQAKAKALGIDPVVVEAPAMAHAEHLARAIASEILRERSAAVPELGPAPSGRIERHCFEWDGFPVSFVDCFSANDIVSTALLCNEVDGLRDAACLRIALFASRADRPMRTRDFVRMLSRETRFDRIAFAGDHRWFASLYLRLFAPEAFPRADAIGCGAREALSDWVGLAARMQRKRLLVVGMGNTHGAGEAWRQTIKTMEGHDDAH